ncbi:MAG: NAD-dependent succinate-semialdehyde dehydrogenase [Pseudohongiellaceae bacterium]|jgi:succinate-semialdehyde dehydrogenase/glutarate-semialdehyde dehydrogenase
MALQSVNPATGDSIKTYDAMDDKTVDSIIDDVHQCSLDWQHSSFEERATLLKRAAEVLKKQKQDLASLMTQEMGKTLKSAEGEVDKCAWVCEYYAEHGEKFLAPEPIDSDASSSGIVYRPLGTVLAVMPWNFPLWQVFRFAAPTLMAGNAGLLKHASNVSGCALAIEAVFREAACPENLFRTLLIGSKQVDRVIENPKVHAVTLTGSTPAGRAVASKAGEMLKKSVLELGGSDAYVVLEDADIEAAAETCVTSRLINAGQSCIAAKRFIVVESVVAEFTERFVKAMAAKQMGDPTDADTDIGPQAREDLRDDLHRQVEDSVSKGATLKIGGEIPDRKGAYYPPTVLTDVKPGMPAYDEEMFGPVAAIITASDEEQAIRIANDSPFGLGAAVFTRNAEKGRQIAEDRLHAGACFVNELVKSDPRLPFGGIKDSGYGRELSYLGIREFVNAKTVYVA